MTNLNFVPCIKEKFHFDNCKINFIVHYESKFRSVVKNNIQYLKNYN